jgi:hypothetical protein
MQFRTRQMSLAGALDEVFLRLFFLGVRALQALIVIPLIGFAAALVNDFSRTDLRIPSKTSAVVGVASTCAAYVIITTLPIVIGGPVFFTATTILDGLFAAAWISLVVVWNGDGSDTCIALERKYFGGTSQKGYFSTDCHLVKAMFAFLIISL